MHMPCISIQSNISILPGHSLFPNLNKMGQELANGNHLGPMLTSHPAQHDSRGKGIPKSYVHIYSFTVEIATLLKVGISINVDQQNPTEKTCQNISIVETKQLAIQFI